MNILSLGVASTKKRFLTITDVQTKMVNTGDGRQAEKIEFMTEEVGAGRQFRISDSWVEDTSGNKRVSGLWLSLQGGSISETSTLAKVLQFYEVDTIGDLVGKRVVAYPDSRDYLVLTACEINE